MNLYTPYNNVILCASALDDKRLKRQITDCMNIYLALMENPCKDTRLISHCRSHYHTFATYCKAVLDEYLYRFDIAHPIAKRLRNVYIKPLILDSCDDGDFAFFEMNNCSTVGIDANFMHRRKLIARWLLDICQETNPKWTKRRPPTFCDFRVEAYLWA